MKALITGASGIGKFVARRLKMDVVTHSLNGVGTDEFGDLTDPNTIIGISKKHGPFDVLVTCQGGKPDDFLESLKLNLLSVVYCCEEISKYMPNNGRIVTLGSYAGCFGRPSGICYSSSKAALHEYTRCLASRLRDRLIAVNCVAPGNTLTERFLSEHGKVEHAAHPDDVASIIAFLCSSEASHISGQVIRVDGGNHTFPC
jgi:3-oxoacyl-[acyl-carrier protein] reductase